MSEQPLTTTADSTEQQAPQWGQVLEFPGQRTDEPAPVLAESERVGEDQTEDVEGEGDPGTEIAVRPDATPAAPERTEGRIPPALRKVGQAAKPRAVAGLKASARHGSYALGGSAHLGRQVGQRVMHGDLTEAVRQARAQGDLGQVAELEQRRREAANDRWRRILIQLKVTGIVSGVLGGGFVATTVAVLIYAVVAGIAPGGATFTGIFTDGYWAGVESVISTLAWAASWWPYALITGLAGLAVTAWNTGRKGEMAPQRVQSNTPTQREVVNLTPSLVVKGLRDLGIAPLRAAIKDDPDAGAWMLGNITRYGPGAQVQVKLPSQVNTEKIRDNRDTLAGNLDRKAHEVIIECSEDSEREFDLWVADSGALDQKLPASPLVDPDYGQVDIYRDRMPWGVSPKGDPVELNLLQQHLLLAGLSKQGKTAAARSILLWLSLDPSTRFLICDLKGFGDWAMFHGLAEHMVEGPGDQQYIDTCDVLEWAVEEQERRFAKWREMGRKGDVDRASSQMGSGFEPTFIVVDECQKLYGCVTEHPDGGDIGGKGKKSRAVRAAQAIHDQGRAVNIHLIQFAQNPTDANLPVIVREGAMIRASLHVGKPSIARMALGDAPVDAGAAPHALRAGRDRGTVVLAPGESMDLPGGAVHTTVRTYFIDTAPAHEVADRAKALRTAPTVVEQPENRDLLADVAEVLGTEDRLKATDVAAGLRKLAPTYKPYKDLGAEGIKSQLEDHGVRVTKADGVLTVRSERVRAELSCREDDAEGTETA